MTKVLERVSAKSFNFLCSRFTVCNGITVELKTKKSCERQIYLTYTYILQSTQSVGFPDLCVLGKGSVSPPEALEAPETSNRTQGASNEKVAGSNSYPPK